MSEAYDATIGSYRYEWRANTLALSSQDEAAIVRLADGGFFAAWSSRRQDGGRYGVYAQRFDPHGVVVQGETSLALWKPAHKTSPSLAAIGNGGVLSVWQSHGQDGDMGAIMLRAFDADGVGSSERLVNESVEGHQSDPVVAVNMNGVGLVVWLDRHDAKAPASLRGRLVSASGLPIGPEFVVAQTDADCGAPSVAAARDGRFAVVYGQSDARRQASGVMCRLFDSGGAPMGESFRVDWPGQSSAGIEPSVAGASEGFAVAWHGLDESEVDYAVWAAVVCSDGSTASPARLIGRADRGGCSGATVAGAADGSFIVAWNANDGDGTGVWARRFDRAGEPAGEPFVVNVHTPGSQRLATGKGGTRLALAEDGTLTCVWAGDAGLGDKSGINLTMLSPSALEPAGQPRGVTPETIAAMSEEARIRAGEAEVAGAAQPHRPPEFKRVARTDAVREVVQNERGGIGFTGISNTGWTPPDPHLAVGPNHLVAMTNGEIAFFTKTGTRTFTDEIEDSFGFWGSVGATGFVFDPEVVYDPHSERFFAMAAEGFAPGGRSYVLIAVSDDSDPNGTWFRYRFETTAQAGNTFDSPNIGVDQTAVYITGDGIGGNTPYPIYIYDKASLIAGTPPLIVRQTSLATTTQSAGIPPVQLGSQPAFYMVEHSEANPATTVRLVALRNGLTTPTISTFTLGVPSYGPPEDPPQSGTTTRPETFDTRFWSVAHTPGTLWATHHVNSSRVRARWYQFNTNGWPTSGSNPTLVQSGEIDGGGTIRTFFSAITADAAGNAAMVFSRGAPTEFFSMATAFRLSGDAAGTFRPMVIERSATGPYNSGRWGDYASIQPDPVTPGRFWAHHEWAQGGSWSTWIASVDVPVCDVDWDHNGTLNASDVGAFLTDYFNDLANGTTVTDFDGNGTVNATDVGAFLTAYFQGCNP